MDAGGGALVYCISRITAFVQLSRIWGSIAVALCSLEREEFSWSWETDSAIQGCIYEIRA